MKKFIALILCLLTFLSTLCGCSLKKATDTAKLKIVASCFPAYDFARQICKDNAQITLLLKPGAEAHDFEPTPSDIIAIKESDLFICVGSESETWVDTLTKSAGDLNIIKMMDIVDCEEDHHHDEHKGHSHSHDDHVWTSPNNAKLICTEIYNNLCIKAPQLQNEFSKNYDSLISSLNNLDAIFNDISEKAENKLLVFADRFPLRHFTDAYGFKVIAAFPGCNSHTEPNIADVIKLIEEVKQNNIPAVFYTEFSNQKMADTVCEETQCKKLLFHSCHNVTKEEWKNNATYYSLMLNNAENLKTALGIN